MKKLLLILLFFYTPFVFSQQTQMDSTLTEQFENNLNEWSEFDTDESSAAIKNGSYNVEHKRTDGSWAYWQTFQVDQTKDYTLEMKLTQTEGTDNYGYGFIWGFQDWNNYNCFLISPNGYFYIAQSADGAAKELIPYTRNYQIKGIDTSNTLKIEQIGNEVHFYINGAEAYRTSKSNIGNKGTYTGSLLFTKKKVSIDYLTIKGKFPVVNFVKEAVKGYQRENLGSNINSIYVDQAPMISADEKILYMIRKKSPDNIGGENAAGEDDVWYAEKNADGSWGKAKNMGLPINNTSNNFVASVSADNNTLFIANLYNKDGSSNGQGLSKSERTDKGWSLPEQIAIKNFYNDAKTVDYFMSQDQQFLLYSISRKDTYGLQDLYFSIRNDNKDGYSEPVNLGSTVNTSGSEFSPFLASDNKTLYFSSNGHPGMGDNDIFVTRRLDDSWQKWSTPENLGPEVNSRSWEADFSLPASGDYAYMASYANSIGKADIVKIKLSTAAKPNPVVLVKGKVLNKKTNEPLEATIHYYDVDTKAEVGSAVSNPNTGQYNIILQSGKKYSFRANKENFYAINDFLDVTTLNVYTETEKNLYLAPLEVGQTIRLNNIFFDVNKAILKANSSEELDRLIVFLKENPQMEIEISGHTDNQGADAYNMTLSQQRVESVLTYMTSKGIPATRLKGKGYGETKAIATNETEEGRATNRRVDFTILKQ